MLNTALADNDQAGDPIIRPGYPDGPKAVANRVGYLRDFSYLSHYQKQVGDVITSAAQVSLSSLPAWVIDSRKSADEAGPLARSALLAIAEGTDDEASAWARTAVKHASETVAHLIDPISLGILGGILIGVILASRVKKIGKVEFYGGVPPEVADIVESAARVITGTQGSA
jgi:hypothetical protein